MSDIFKTMKAGFDRILKWISDYRKKSRENHIRNLKQRHEFLKKEVKVKHLERKVAKLEKECYPPPKAPRGISEIEYPFAPPGKTCKKKRKSDN